MLSVLTRIAILSALVLSGALYCAAQSSADNRSSIFGAPGDSEKDERPGTIRDTLEKMRIEKEKKDFNRMVERGEQAVKIATELENSLKKKGRLTESEKSKLASVEKLAKQIRSDLGGGDDDSAEKIVPQRSAVSLLDAVKSLRSSTESLFQELKKTSRFTVSAAAIQSSNAVLTLARFLRISQ